MRDILLNLKHRQAVGNSQNPCESGFPHPENQNMRAVLSAPQSER